MEASLPVALSAQLAIERRLDTVAHNLANLRTAGFRSEEISFEELVKRADAIGSDPVSLVDEGESYISTRAGELTQTGNPLDMAVAGDAYFAYQGENGLVYTRDGRMRINEAGGIETLTGYPLVDVGGAGLQIDPNGGEVIIARDGMITQDGRQLGAVGLFTIPANAKLTRLDTSGVIPDQAAQPALDFSQVGVMQGFVEGSNVNPILEMTRLITLQRTFESAANLVRTNESSLSDAIRTLGGTS
ncbi:flagellar basal-body rod protein FlgF [Jiella marina]|uniref:flagellar basal-body rod protein FlgF n=1 Tax=Jiella sp. LLJ827 TaxID=2917712 RepID=UPI002101B32C|nr:flagellar basal-body rod protein FlgF [Jiella sp. LLJ827]MCQ0986744.1 flagellar basal-body rod protein FlgF [Jiella sp. LLJ827]